MTAAPAITLNDGASIPALGFGLYKVAPEVTEETIATAIEAGYRHFDTASLYGNERETGRAIRSAGLPREDVFLVTKVWNADQGYERTLAAFDRSAHLLGLDALGGYLDLYLIHWPMASAGRFVDTFRALTALRDQGRVRSIGVSNFAPEHLATLVDATGIVPAVNQVELHPLLSQRELRQAHAQLGIATEAWSPLARGALLDDPAVVAVADAHGRTPAQVVIRWHLQLGNIVIPKSVTPERIASNFDVFDFALSEDDMASIDALDPPGSPGNRLGPDPRTFDFTGR